MEHAKTVFVRPTKEVVLTFWKCVGVVLLIFLATYLFANHLAAQNPNRYEMFTEWELGVPLVPWMIVVYLSYVAVFLLLPMIARSGQAIISLAYGFLVAIFVSTIVFILFPGELGYARPEYVSGYDFLFQALYQIDKPHNLYPSLHVTFSSLTAFAMAHQSKVRWFQMLILLWAVVIAASVILVHQHHLFDILTGAILASVCYKYVYLRFVDSNG